MNVAVVIPARYQSTRFPGKPLADLGGKSVIVRVVEQVRTCGSVNTVIVATDDVRIFDHVQRAGYTAVMTADAHLSGTDRVAEVATTLAATDVIVNVQGDEPFISATQIERVLQPFRSNDGVRIATLAHPLRDAAALFDPNVVKVTFDPATGRALYFSRHPIPYLRDVSTDEWVRQARHFRHLGIYAFRRTTLLDVQALPPSSLERAESLEQLRWLQNGHSIHVALTEEIAFGIDTPADLERARTRLRSKG